MVSLAGRWADVVPLSGYEFEITADAVYLSTGWVLLAVGLSMLRLAAKLGIALSLTQLRSAIIAAAELPQLFPPPLSRESQTDARNLLIG